MPRIEDEKRRGSQRRSRPNAKPRRRRHEEGTATVISLIVVVVIRDGCVRGRDVFRRTVIGDRAYTVEFATTVRRSSAVEQAAHGQGQPLGETQGCNWVNCRET